MRGVHRAKGVTQHRLLNQVLAVSFALDDGPLTVALDQQIDAVVATTSGVLDAKSRLLKLAGHPPLERVRGEETQLRHAGCGMRDGEPRRAPSCPPSLPGPRDQAAEGNRADENGEGEQQWGRQRRCSHVCAQQSR